MNFSKYYEETSYRKMISLNKYESLICAKSILGTVLSFEPMSMDGMLHIMGDDYVRVFLPHKREQVIDAIKSIISLYDIDAYELFCEEEGED